MRAGKTQPAWDPMYGVSTGRFYRWADGPAWPPIVRRPPQPPPLIGWRAGAAARERDVWKECVDEEGSVCASEGTALEAYVLAVGQDRVLKVCARGLRGDP